MTPYKSLTKYEKLQYISATGVSGPDNRHQIAIYLKALWLNNQEYIDEFESYGEDPFKVLDNKLILNRQLVFGFTDFQLDEYGRIKRPVFLNLETISFKTKNESVDFNSVEVAMGKNGKWTFGICYCTGNTGGSSGISIWNTILNTKREALILGLETLIDRHKSLRKRLHKKDNCGNYNEAYSNAIVKQAQNKLDFILGLKTTQYQLF